jgi:hypothetical protein
MTSFLFSSLSTSILSSSSCTRIKPLPTPCTVISHHLVSIPKGFLSYFSQISPVLQTNK